MSKDNPFKKALRQRQRAWSKTISNETRARALSDIARLAARGDAYATELIKRATEKLPWLADKMTEAVEAERLAIPPPPPKVEPASAPAAPQGESQVWHASVRAVRAHDEAEAARLASGHAKAVEGPLSKVLNGSRPAGLQWADRLKRLFDRATDDPGSKWMK